MKESDMYEPIKNILSAQGFIVRGEVKGCDIAAINGDVLWIVEMKLSANITLIYQAMERQKATNYVFVAIPRPKKKRGDFSSLQSLLKKLGIGLITVALDSAARQAEIILFPKDGKKQTKKTDAIKKEIFGRTTDSIGGTTKTAINTAYRERCVRIACLIEAKGEMSAKTLVQLGCEKDAYSIISTNFYGWFKKIAKGTYDITDVCRNYLSDNESVTLITYYRMKASE